MATQLEPIAALLKAAREKKGLSQRALGQRVGLPQSHISKIESAAVDLQTSSLIEIARAVGLELTLLPRSALPAVHALQGRGSTEASRLAGELIDRQLLLLISQARRLARRFPAVKVFGQLTKTAGELRQLQLGVMSAAGIRQLTETVNDVLRRAQKLAGQRRMNQTVELLIDEIETRSEELRRSRNSIAHGITYDASKPLPAYRLDEDGESDG